MGTRFYSANENAIEWIRGEDRITVTLSDKEMINTVKRLAKKYKNDIEIIALPSNNDGYLYARLPLSFLQIRYPGVRPEPNEEQSEMYRNLMKGINDRRKKAKEHGTE